MKDRRSLIVFGTILLQGTFHQLISQKEGTEGGPMGLLDALAREFLPKLFGGGANTSPLANIITSLLTNPQTGGLGGLVESFKGQGMEDIINSWIGTGKNMPISPSEMMKALGSDRLRGLSETGRLRPGGNFWRVGQYSTGDHR